MSLVSSPSPSVRRRRLATLGGLLLTLFVVRFATLHADDDPAARPSAAAAEPAFPEPTDDQPLTTPRTTPAEALARLQAPEGFRTSLFAAEPQVRQPIAATFDSRGRMWVAENYTYANVQKNYDLQFRDRIVILEDTDGDGDADKRSVFWDQAQRLTSVEVGFGGVWALAPPYLLFLPDEDGDDRPDGPPVVMLDGWDDSAARHNFVNGLKWGPDGWLYGRNGILATSLVGAPGATNDQRTPINCGMWRFHPVRRVFETVCSGTTNPWGHDWDDHGQLFFINTVIGHLWHVVPGAHFRRMYGEDLNPYAYELIEQTADHFHWDVAKEEWRDQRKGVTEGTDKAGGGHAHSGLMFYLGDAWPSAYRGALFTVNLHGRRLNRERIERAGATYVGRHEPDFLKSDDPWFRAIDLLTGPDGGVYILDWSDIGECHENDGVDRSSGRIFKLDYAGSTDAARKPGPPLPLDRLAPTQLVKLQLHTNDWYVRQSRRLLQERHVRGEDLSEARRELEDLLAKHSDVTRRLRALWALHVTGGLAESRLLELLDDREEHVRLWAVQLLVESPPGDAAVAALVRRATAEKSGLVLTYLASALRRLPLADRLALAGPLVEHGELADDRVYPLMVWYGIEGAVAADPQRAVALLDRSRLPKVDRFTARRLAAQIDVRPAGPAALVARLAAGPRRDSDRDLLLGLADGLRGWQKADAPAGWSELAARLAKSDDAEVRRLAQELSIVFGDGRAIDEVKRIAADGGQPTASRRQAVRALAASRAPGLVDTFTPLLTDAALADEAVRGLAAVDPTGGADTLLSHYPRMNRVGRLAVVDSLAARRTTAARLLDAVESRVVARNEVSTFILRQIQLLGDEGLQSRIAKLWPELRLIAADRLATIAKYREQLTESRLAQADLTAGKKLYAEACGKCHKLFGEGGAIGPELTGAQRSNLNYWLENIVDPSAVVGAGFRMSVVELEDGRVLNGVVSPAASRTLYLQTPTEKMTLDRRQVVSIRESNLSLMPEAQLATWSSDQVRDLIGYLMSDGGRPAPAP